LERTRLIQMYLASIPISPETRILHMAPERGLFNYLNEKTQGKRYVTADFFPKLFPFAGKCQHIDLCNLDEWKTGAFDLIIHSHVLEHTPCNIAYTMFHLDRILAPGGRQICVIPFMPGSWDESFSEMPDAERISRFGQNDHVRRFGRDDLQPSLGKIMRVPETFDAEADLGRELLISHNIPESEWRGFHGSTILIFKKGDYLLSPDTRSGSIPVKANENGNAPIFRKYKNVVIAAVALYVLIMIVAAIILML
jgi:phosphoglycolate phosphatase